MKNNYKTALLSLGLFACMSFTEVSKNNMTAKWWYSQDRIFFNLSAPTTGWLTAGINETDNTTGAYLMMGRIRKGNAEVVEHYTQSPGNYHPITDLGGKDLVKDITGSQTKSKSEITFSVPINSQTKYRKNLSKGKTYYLILAYSRDDDFQHHSSMRTSVKITL